MLLITISTNTLEKGGQRESTNFSYYRDDLCLHYLLASDPARQALSHPVVSMECGDRNRANTVDRTNCHCIAHFAGFSFPRGDLVGAGVRGLTMPSGFAR